MRTLETGINDRGSRYAVSGGPAADRGAVQALLARLRTERRFQKATHNSWAVVLPDGTPLKGDDGEAGAGNVILDVLRHAGVTGHAVIVTRWYGGKRLGGDRFRHVRTAAALYVAALPPAGTPG